jgi:hypothetical protein
MTNNAKAGRRARRGTPMPTTSFSASVEELVFLILLGKGSLSPGVQDAIQRLVESDEEAAALMEQAKRLIADAEQHLEKDEFGRVPQRTTYLHISQNYWQLLGE